MRGPWLWGGGGRAARTQCLNPRGAPAPAIRGAPGVRPCCDFPKSSLGRARPPPSLSLSLPARPRLPLPSSPPPLTGEGDESFFMLAAGAEGRPPRVPGAARPAVRGAELELGGRAGGLPAAGRARRRLPLHARTSRNKVSASLHRCRGR